MSINTSVRLPDDLHAWLVSEAERHDRSAGWIIVKALRAWEAASGDETTNPQSPVTTGDPGLSRVPASPRAHDPDACLTCPTNVAVPDDAPAIEGLTPSPPPRAHGPGPKTAFTPRPKGAKR